MAPNRIMRRGAALRALWILLACLALSLALAACGSGGGSTTVTVTAGGGSAPASKPEADAKILNHLLARQLAVAATYEHSLRYLHGEAREAARLFEQQEQEHVDAMEMLLRGLGQKSEPPAETIEAKSAKKPSNRLRFLYEIEAATVRNGLKAIAKLTSPNARSTLSSIVANQAQHLAALRTLLGASLVGSIPIPLENGTEAAPGR